jgi:hypothetical protein
MKIAVLVVGGQYVGKTKTINKYLKPMLAIKMGYSKFILNGKKGRAWTQSLEEANRSIDLFIHICIRYELIVVPCRPSNDKTSLLAEVEERLKKEGFIVYQVQVEKSSDESYYNNKAKEIFNHLQ